jgi:hypothetical protein
MNYDGNVVESYHKNEKNSGKRAQLRAYLLDKQTADKRKEYSMLIKKAYDAVHTPKSIFQSEFQTETKSDGYLSAKKMAYVDSIGLCFTNAKGKVSKKVHSMHEMEYLIHQINDYFAKFFEDKIVSRIFVSIFGHVMLPNQMRKNLVPFGETIHHFPYVFVTFHRLIRLEFGNMFLDNFAF